MLCQFNWIVVRIFGLQTNSATWVNPDKDFTAGKFIDGRIHWIHGAFISNGLLERTAATEFRPKRRLAEISLSST